MAKKKSGKAVQKREVEQLSVAMAEQLRGLHGELRAVRGIAGLAAVVPKVIEAVEQAGEQNDWHGLDKRALAVAIILQLVPLPAWLPRPLATVVLTYAVEKAVAEYNKHAAPRLASIWRTVKGWFGFGK